MKKKYLTIAAFLFIPSMAFGNGTNGFVPNTYLFADQDIYVGGCLVEGFNPSPGLVCINCSLTQFDSLVLDGQWCGGKIKWDTGYINAAGEIITITTNKKGNPIPGRFPYKDEFSPYINGENGIDGNGLANFDGCPMFYPSYNTTECSDASDVCVPGATGPVVVAIHADVYNYYDEKLQETAWAAEYLLDEDGTEYWGTEFPGKNWATYVHVPCNTGLPGECSEGLLTCGGEGAVCVSIQNSVEICDGLDNNCDGDVDEGFPNLEEECSPGIGECQNFGQYVCTPDGSGTECNVEEGDPSPELCNDLDDDCDGQVDNGFPGLGQNCIAGIGECEADGEFVCAANGLETECDAIPGQPSPEDCDDGLDNDCDGLTDDADIDDCDASACIDDDGDGYGALGDPLCPNPGVDCDDNNQNIHPGAYECDANLQINNVDNDCDYVSDPGGSWGDADQTEGCWGEGCATTADCVTGLVCDVDTCYYPD